MSYGIRENVRRMVPYTPGKPIEEVKRELGLERVVKLASNENPLGPSAAAVRAVEAAAGQMHLYPDASGYELRSALAARAGLGRENVMLGNGSDELIHLLGLVFLSHGDNMVVADPTFVRYDAAAHLADIELRKVSLDGEWRHNLAAMASACDDRTKLVFVANPHNPTGTVLGRSAVEGFLDGVPEGAVVVLDEAYAEYASDLADFPDGVGLVRSGRRVVVLRTFSKAYGLAGIRVGYGFGAAEVVDAVDRAREPFDVNSLAQAAALAALGDEGHLARSRAVNLEGLERISAAAAEMGLETVPSRANFICVRVGAGQEVFEALLRRGVIVRSGGPLGMPEHIRVSIGTPEEVDVFLAEFRAVMAERGVLGAVG